MAEVDCPYCDYSAPLKSVEAHISGSSNGDHEGQVGRNHREELVEQAEGRETSQATLEEEEVVELPSVEREVENGDESDESGESDERDENSGDDESNEDEGEEVGEGARIDPGKALLVATVLFVIVVVVASRRSGSSEEATEESGATDEQQEEESANEVTLIE